MFLWFHRMFSHANVSHCRIPRTVGLSFWFLQRSKVCCIFGIFLIFSEFFPHIFLDFTVEHESHRKYYNIELIEDVRPNSNVNFGLFPNVTTSEYTASCGVYLEPMKTYLIGGDFREDSGLPFMFSCRSFWEQWTVSDEESKRKIESIRKQCKSINE